MKISKVQIDVIERDTGLLKVKDERSGIGGKITQGVLRLFTDEGIEGNAFIADQAQPSDQRITVIDQILRPKIMNMDITHREWLWSVLESIPGENIYQSWSAIDVALWDLEGKRLNKPIYSLLGGKNDEIELYATYPPRHDNPAGFIREAEQLLEEVFSAYKRT